jgi:hypothetical protein
MFLVPCHPTEDGILVPSSGRWLNSGMGSLTEFLTLKTLESHNGDDGFSSSLAAILEIGPLPQKYYLSPKACKGILRRIEKREMTIPDELKKALAKGCA